MKDITRKDGAFDTKESSTPQQTTAAQDNAAIGELPSSADSSQQPANSSGADNSKVQRPTSERKIAANRKNAKASTGPRTDRGKTTTRLNALKHGYYLRVVPEKERPEVDALRSALQATLEPSTPLQFVAFEQIVSWIRISKKSAQWVMQRLDAGLDSLDEREPSPVDSNEGNLSDKPYASGRVPRRQCLSLLEALKRDVQQTGGLDPRWKDTITANFGSQCFDLFMKWAPDDRYRLLSARAFAFGEITYNVPAPEDMPLTPFMASMRDGTKVVTDPEQDLEMLLKLIDEKRRHVAEIDQLQRSGAAEQASSADPTPRSLAMADRELRRAVEWYFHLKDSNL